MKRTTRILIVISLCMLVLCLTACNAATHRDAALDVRQNVAQPVEKDSASDPEEDMDEPDAPEKEKIPINIAGVGCSLSKLKMVINEFNKTDSDYMVILTDCGYGMTAEQGRMNLQTKLLSGNRPDMLLFDNEVYLTSENPADALSPLPYISSGILMDLDELVQSDPELSSEDFIIWDALHEFDGMYVIGPKFWVNALCCLPETAERYRNWTLDDYLELQASLGDGQKLMYYITPEAFVRYVGSRYAHETVDIETATCDFENQNFIAILEAARQIKIFSAEDDHMQNDGSFKSAQEMLIDGDLLFFWVELYSAVDISFDRYCSGGIRIWYNEGESPYKDRTGGSKPLAYIGYPTPDGSNGMYVELPYSVGVCAGTEKQEGCWEFIRYMLENPMYQDAYDGTPVLSSKLAENLEFIVQATERNRWDTKKSDQDVLVEVAGSCDTMSYYDEDILTIIEEEAAGVLTGSITAEQAAKRVQNRASVLVMERYG